MLRQARSAESGFLLKRLPRNAIAKFKIEANFLISFPNFTESHGSRDDALLSQYTTHTRTIMPYKIGLLRYQAYVSLACAELGKIIPFFSLVTLNIITHYWSDGLSYPCQ